MDMKVDSSLIRTARLQRAWSQEHLAQVCGLGERTVQRIEQTGTASLESIKALAAVLEIPVDRLVLLDNPAPAETTPAHTQSTWLSNRWRSITTTATLLVAAAGFVVTGNVFAEQVMMDFKLKVLEEPAVAGQLTSNDGEENELRMSDELKITLMPRITENGAILISAAIYRLDNGTYQVIARPQLLIEDTQTGALKVAPEGRNLIEFTVTPQIR